MSILHNAPRLVVAGLAGDSGKSIVALAILHRLRQTGMPVRAFKKGPDYIDAAWLSWVTGEPARNLDTWLMGFDRAAQSFHEHAINEGVNLVEGNRGLFDGFDARGTHSTAELAKAIQAPVLLVMNAAKMTRTAAALALGCQRLDPDLNLAGVILNRVHGARHESIARAAMEEVTNLPVVGAVPAFAEGVLPSRHLGLVTPSDYAAINELPAMLEKIAASLDMEQILKIADSAPELPHTFSRRPQDDDFGRVSTDSEEIIPRIAVIRDAAFNFYYPENLEALSAGGAELRFVSSLEAMQLPEDVDAIYIGGGFPEVHAARLGSNSGFLRWLAESAARNVPIYAECGGLMLLSSGLQWQGKRYAMAGVLPFDVVVETVPQGHGYVELEVTQPNPFYAPGTVLRGHEFHYSRIVPQAEMPVTACAVRRGTGAFAKRDGIVQGSVWASYTHLHAAASPKWAEGLLRAARTYLRSLNQESQPCCQRAG